MDKFFDREAREELLNRLRLKYHTLSEFEKDEAINALILSTGYNRKSAIRALNQAARERPTARRRQKRSRYDAVLPILRQLWKAANYLCGKRPRSTLMPDKFFILRYNSNQKNQSTCQEEPLCRKKPW